MQRLGGAALDHEVGLCGKPEAQGKAEDGGGGGKMGEAHGKGLSLLGVACGVIYPPPRGPGPVTNPVIAGIGAGV